MNKRRSGCLRLLVLTFFAALGTASCGDDATAPDEDGPFTANFTATITGGTSRTISGTAVFASGADPASGETVWVLYMATAGGSPQSASDIIYFFGSGSPSEGTKAVQDIEGSNLAIPTNGVAGLIVMTGNTAGLFGAFESQSGTLVVERLSATRMDGTFNFTALGSVIVGQSTTVEEINVRGTFQAGGGIFLFPAG